jgi:hypothetical protein
MSSMIDDEGRLGFQKRIAELRPDTARRWATIVPR